MKWELNGPRSVQLFVTDGRKPATHGEGRDGMGRLPPRHEPWPVSMPGRYLIVTYDYGDMLCTCIYILRREVGT